METTLELKPYKAGREVTWQTGASEPANPRLAGHDTVARRAYEIWQRHGCPNDTAFHDWLAAEAQLRSAR